MRNQFTTFLVIGSSSQTFFYIIIQFRLFAVAAAFGSAAASLSSGKGIRAAWLAQQVNQRKTQYSWCTNFCTYNIERTPILPERYNTKSCTGTHSHSQHTRKPEKCSVHLFVERRRFGIHLVQKMSETKYTHRFH